MMIFMSGILLLLLIALSIVWLPFWRRSAFGPINVNRRDKTNADIYQRQIAAVEKQFEPDEPAFILLRNELALGLLSEEKPLIRAEQDDKASIVLPILFSAIVIGLPLVGYSVLGDFSEANRYLTQAKSDPLAGLSNEEITDIKLTQLLEKIRTNPQDGDAWFILTEYYLYTDQFDNALVALSRVAAITGETNQTLAAKALILYYQNGQRISPEIQALLDRVLADDPLHLTALMLMASDFYYRAEYRQAINIWQRLLDSDNPQIDRKMLIERINVARMMANRQ